MSPNPNERPTENQAMSRQSWLQTPIRLEVVCVIAIAGYFGWGAIGSLWNSISWYKSDDPGLQGLAPTALLAAAFCATIALICLRWLYRRFRRLPADR